ncbi:hypothetical protein [Clostridium butyricum]
MSKSVGVDKVIEHLKYEKDRFLKAGKSGLFCDCKSCLKTACTISFAIDEINKIRKNLDC